MTDEEESMCYSDSKPDVPALSQWYQNTVGDLGYYRSQCQLNRDTRRNEWAGKTSDLRKHGENPFPWDGASDQEVHLVEENIAALVSLSMSALDRSHVKALAVKMESMPRASSMSAFAKWMMGTYIRDFRDQHEKVCNYGYERGLMISYIGWEKREVTVKQILNLEQIRAINPELAGMIETGQDDELIVSLLQEQWPKLKDSKAKKCLKQLRTDGEAELYVSRSGPMDSRPVVIGCDPGNDVFYPSYTRDPQNAPYIFWRQTYTVQQIESFVTNDGWDRQWADEMIENYRGVGVDDVTFSSTYFNVGAPNFPTNSDSVRDLILVVHAYQRLVDPDDGSEGIYETTFNPYYTGAMKNVPAYGKKVLHSGCDRYPFVATRMSVDCECMYDLQALPEKTRGSQWTVKVERDSRADRNSLATLPPREGPAGREPSQWGPGRYIPTRRRGEYGYIESPQFNPGSVEMEQAAIKMAKSISGLDPEDPLTPIRQQFFVNKTLHHACEVMKAAYRAFQQYGPDQVFFNVTGVPDPITVDNISDDEFDFSITFDTLSNDPETMKARAEQMGSIMAMDTMGRIDRSRFIEFLAYSIDPAFASHILLPAQDNQMKMESAITEDFAKLYGGVAVGAQPNGAQLALGMTQQWMQQPDVSQRYQSDEAFRKRVDDYMQQYTFQLQQAQNAQIGRIGTAPTDFQGSNISPQ